MNRTLLYVSLTFFSEKKLSAEVFGLLNLLSIEVE